MLVTIEVTEEMIVLGKPKCPSLCPIALAINKSLGERFSCSVGIDYLSIYDFYNSSIDLSLPFIAQEFVAATDNDNKTIPIKFELDIPDVFLREPQQ